MGGNITLVGGQRKALLGMYRKDPDPSVRMRAQIILLLAEPRYTWAVVAAVMFCSTATILRWKEHFEREGVEGLRVERRGRREVASGPGGTWLRTVLRWVLKLPPSVFGLARSRWSCEAVALVLMEVHQVKVSRETVRRWLAREQVVWRRPRPVPGPKDPQRKKVLAGLRDLLAKLPADEVAVFQDEVDVNLNPKIGCMWMRKGKQAKVVTPGTNRKKYIAGSLDWRTGKLTATEGEKRNAALFVAHLDDLRNKYRRYKVIHVICDNARFHGIAGSHLVGEYMLKWEGRIKLHYLPTYSPDANPVERVWTSASSVEPWRMHEAVTRNHRCPDLDSLMDMVFQWLGEKGTFSTASRFYPEPPRAKKKQAA
jgi:transposase